MEKGDSQNHLRGDGSLPLIAIDAENLGEATHKAIVGCYERGLRVETPKQRPDAPLGYDADMIIRVANPDAEPKVHFKSVTDDGRGVMQYILEVTHGIHNHWKKNPTDPATFEFWGYTYNERFVDQIPFILQRIKHDWDKRGRITGRDYQWTTWRAGEDIILDQDDPPCLQRGHFRFTTDKDGTLVLNYCTDWRSRDLVKAWNENNIGQIELMKRFAEKVSDKLGVPVKLGAYIDRSSSLHIYGNYIGEGFEKQLKQMQETPYQDLSTTLEDCFAMPDMDDAKSLKRLIAAQSDAESKGHGKQQSKSRLIELGYDLSTFQYPQAWDSWDPKWDTAPNPELLARVLRTKDIDQQVINKYLSQGFASLEEALASMR